MENAFGVYQITAVLKIQLRWNYSEILHIFML